MNLKEIIIKKILKKPLDKRGFICYNKYNKRKKEVNKMMKMYKVEMKKLTFDMGLFDGYKTIGYYTSKAKAERIAKERYENRSKIVEGETYVREIEVDDEE